MLIRIVLRTVRALPDFRFWGWLVWGWTLLAHASTASFSVGVIGSISTWLSHNAWAGLLAGGILIALAIAGPDLAAFVAKQPWAAKLRLPPTVGERFNKLESHVGAHLGTDTNFAALHATVSGPVQRWVAESTRDIGSLKNSVSALALRADSLEVAISSASGRLDEHRPWIHDLELKLTAQSGLLASCQRRTDGIVYDLSELEKSARVTCTALQEKLDTVWDRLSTFGPNFSRILLKLQEVNGMIFDYATSLKFLEELKQRYPEVAVARQPFSRQWSKLNEGPEVPLLAIEWATFHEHLVARCELAASQGHSLTDMISVKLLTYKAWDSQDSMKTSVDELVNQKGILLGLRSAYAANLDRSIALKDTSS